MAETMPAIRLEAPHVARLCDLPRPAPATGDVLIRVRATGICGTDIELYEGTAPYLRSGRARYPIVPGHEWAGVVESTGAGVTGFSPGQQVVGECSVGCGTCARCRAGAYHICPDLTETGILNRDGGFARFIAMPARALHRVADHVPPASAALVEPTAVALNGVRKSGAVAGDALVIHGDGPIGLLALLVARALGLGPVALVGADSARLTLARDLGAAQCFNIRDATPDLPPHAHALEATGRPEAVQAAIAGLSPGGTLALLGLFGGRRTMMDFDPLVIGDLTLRGVLGSPGLWPETIALIESGAVDPGPLISHRLPLAEFDAAITRAKARDGVKCLLEQP
ncbi:zinc-dependent alcohol dehydrogenase [Oceaniglobus trochenteri]|uniref:zinc-dependent alcohol dehydrogenase n=1 Tax=Oceaniglobus trochenteri TaxID=2763260 RepID=UPI001CFF8453|nr:alcohol dehydrogenase catalytic domain-containing protein [Oceaniglobus trochenteri]